MECLIEYTLKNTKTLMAGKQRVDFKPGVNTVDSVLWELCKKSKITQWEISKGIFVEISKKSPEIPEEIVLNPTQPNSTQLDEVEEPLDLEKILANNIEAASKLIQSIPHLELLISLEDLEKEGSNRKNIFSAIEKRREQLEV
jgi:hypothetical protein